MTKRWGPRQYIYNPAREMWPMAKKSYKKEYNPPSDDEKLRLLALVVVVYLILMAGAVIETSGTSEQRFKHPFRR